MSALLPALSIASMSAWIGSELMPRLSPYSCRSTSCISPGWRGVPRSDWLNWKTATEPSEEQQKRERASGDLGERGGRG